jgi:hypothetical protein
MNSCNGTTCSYTCNAGASDCNKGTAPDVDGCECATPGCCGSGCQTVHSNGWGQSFYDCNPLNTFTSANAIEACTAYAKTVGGTSSNCQDVWECSGVPPTFVCYSSTNLNQCYGPCWNYASGAQQGGVEGGCTCPFTKAATWN